MTEWEVLSEGLDTLFRREPMTPEKYMNLYTTVYNYCTTLKALPAHQDSSDEQITRRAMFVDDSYIGYELYNKLRNYITNVTIRIYEKGAELKGKDLLKYFNTEWQNFCSSARVTSNIFDSLSRHYIARELYEGNPSIYTIYTHCLVLFQQNVFHPLETEIIAAALHQIREERKGNPANPTLVLSVITWLLEIGKEMEADDEKDVNPMESAKLNAYKTSFQDKFIKDTSDFYEEEIEQLLSQRRSVTDYMLEVETRFLKENLRLSLYLNDCTREPLIKCCEKVLISDHLEFLAINFGQLLANEQDDDLMRMYGMCSRVPDGLDRLCVALKEYVCKEGLEAVKRVADLAFNDPKLYVKTLLEVHQKYRQLVEHFFNDDPGFMQSLDKATIRYVNVNAVVNQAPASMQLMKTEEMLVRYCDQLLRKSSRMSDETEMENLQTEAMTIFKYLEDKDVFLNIYAKWLSKRLINEVSASEEAEASFINKMRAMCGFEYTKCLMQMMLDMQVSKELFADFKKKVTEEMELKPMDFNVMVLTDGSWPLFPTCDLKLPRQLSTKIEEFKSFYHTKFNGRRLSWIYSQSRGELTSFAFQKKYVFMLTTFQMCILLLFNEQDSYTCQDILEATDMDKKTTLSVVDSLIKGDVLKPSVGIEEGERISLTASLTLNKLYYNKKLRVNLLRNVIKSDVVKESIDLQKSAEDDRRNMIKAAIVRIMKTRKSIQHLQLITEVIDQLSRRFKPNVEMIKQSIESLIEKEYLKRDSNQKDLYEYID